MFVETMTHVQAILMFKSIYLKKKLLLELYIH